MVAGSKKMTCPEAFAEVTKLQTELDDITKTSVIFLTKEIDTLIEWTTERMRVNQETRRNTKRTEQNRERIEQIDNNHAYYTGILEKLMVLRHGD